MSLIDEALRRVQDPLAAKELPPAPPQAPKAPNPPPIAAVPGKKNAPAHSWRVEPSAKKKAENGVGSPRPRFLGLSFTLLIAIAVLSWLVAALNFRPINWRGNSASKSQHSTADAGKDQSPGPAPAVDPRPSAYQITGVVVGVGEPYAVINGQILARGEIIGQAEVVKIAQNAVTLQLPDKTQIVLKVPR